jgi:ActR/RegA family two-component response regulator
VDQVNSHVDVRVPSVPIGSALLVCNDPATIKPLSKSMQQLAILTEVCGEVAAAPGVFNRRKFGAIVVDLQLGDQARRLLEKVRRSPSNRTSVIFAISDSDAETAVAFKGGSNFVLRRPLSESSTNQKLRAGHGLILREQRRYFRCPVDVPATLKCPGMQEVCGHVVNISEGGIAIITSVLLKPGVEVQAQFTLPGYGSQFAVKAAICWCRDGYMGLRFMSLSPELKTKLQDWLSRHLEQHLPGRLPANSELWFSRDHKYAKA